MIFDNPQLLAHYTVPFLIAAAAVRGWKTTVTAGLFACATAIYLVNYDADSGAKVLGLAIAALWLSGFVAGLAARAITLPLRPAKWRPIAVAIALVAGYVTPLVVMSGPSKVYHRLIG